MSANTRVSPSCRPTDWATTALSPVSITRFLIPKSCNRSSTERQTVRIGHQPGYGSVDGNVQARVTLVITPGSIGLGLANTNIILLQEPLVADMHIIAIDLAFDTKAQSI